jgi:hypothetical protein
VVFMHGARRVCQSSRLAGLRRLGPTDELCVQILCFEGRLIFDLPELFL